MARENSKRAAANMRQVREDLESQRQIQHAVIDDAQIQVAGACGETEKPSVK